MADQYSNAPSPDPAVSRRSTGIITRRAFLGICAGAGALTASACMWRMRWQPGSAHVVIPPEDTGPDAAPPFVHPLPPTTEPTVRVRVHRARDPRNPAVVGAEGQWVRIQQDYTSMASVALRAPLSVRMGASGWVVTDSLGFAASVAGVDPFDIRPDDTQLDDDGLSTIRAGHVELGNRQYPGMLRLIARTDIAPYAFDVVNHLPLEHYLPGVVARELYNHWHYEAHAAQAIAARSFACSEHVFYLNRRHFDLADDDSSQAYVGTTAHRTSLDAVANTRGQVLAYENLLVPGYYSSCCGGRAAAAPDAIGPNPINAIAPLLGQSQMDVCTTAPPCQWNAQRPIDVSTQRVVAWAKSRGNRELARIKTLTSITPVGTNDHGRPTRYRISDAAGAAVELPAEHLRFALNYSDETVPAPARSLRSSHFTATFSGPDILFQGHGYGHGVGLCQYGAQIRASELGHSHRAILNWYYPGAQIIAAYA